MYYKQGIDGRGFVYLIFSLRNLHFKSTYFVRPTLKEGMSFVYLSPYVYMENEF